MPVRAPGALPRPALRPLAALLATSLAAGALAGCSGPGGDDLLAPSSAVTVGVASGPVALQAGRSATITLSIGRMDVDGDVTLAVERPPAGLTVSLARERVGRQERTAALVVTAAADARAGSYLLTVTARAGGTRGATTTVPVTVSGATAPVIGLATAVAASGVTVTAGQSTSTAVTLSRGGGFDGDITLAAGSLPAGVTATLDPTVLPAGTTTATLTLAVAANAPGGGFGVTLRASGPGGTPTTTATVPLTISGAPTVALALPATALPVTQGTTAAARVSLTRQGFAGDVTLAADAPPAGLVVPTTTIVAGITSGTLLVQATTAAAVGPATITVRATGPGGIVVGTRTLAVTVAAPSAPPVDTTTPPAPTPPPSIAPVGTFGLIAEGASPTHVEQGGPAVSAPFTVVRLGGNTSALTLSAAGAPAGLTVALPTAPVTGTATAVGITATSQAAPGDYRLVVRASAPGHPNAEATLLVRVAPPAPTGSAVRWSFCAPASQHPRWFAVQNEYGAWTRVLPTPSGANVHFDFRLGARGAVAWVAPSGSPDAPGTTLNVTWGSTTELALQGTTQCNYAPLGGPRIVQGKTTGLGASDRALVTSGAVSAYAFAPIGGDWTLGGLPDAPATLLASRIDGATLSSNRIILRRSATLPTSGLFPTLDFGAAEAFAPATARLNVQNAGADQLSSSTALYAGQLATAAFAVTTATGGPLQYVGLPDARLLAGELQSVTAIAEEATVGALRGSATFTRSVVERTLAFGPPLPSPVVTRLIGSHLRARFELSAVPEYAGLASATIVQGTRTVVLGVTPGYTDGAPGTWDFAMPDFGAVAGFDPSWAPQSGTSADWQVLLFGGDQNLLLGVRPTEGTSYRYATRSGAFGATAAASRGTNLVLLGGRRAVTRAR